MITSTLSVTSLECIQQEPWTNSFISEISQTAREKILSATPHQKGKRWQVQVSLEEEEAEEITTILDDIAGYGESLHNLPLEVWNRYRAVRNDSIRWAESFR